MLLGGKEGPEGVPDTGGPEANVMLPEPLHLERDQKREQEPKHLTSSSGKDEGEVVGQALEPTNQALARLEAAEALAPGQGQMNTTCRSTVHGFLQGLQGWNYYYIKIIFCQ